MVYQVLWYYLALKKVLNWILAAARAPGRDRGDVRDEARARFTRDTRAGRTARLLTVCIHWLRRKMARKDRTYTSDDVIRIYLRNLDASERAIVEDFFSFSPVSRLNEVLDVIVDIIGLIPVVGEIAELAGVVIDVIELSNEVKTLEERLKTIERLGG